MKAVAVVPAYNEEKLIGATVRSLRTLDGIERVLVVDDASSDSTAAEALASGATVVVNGTNLGKGASLNRVLEGLVFDALLLVDGDLGEHAAEADKLLEPVLSGRADLSIAAFPAPTKKGGFGLAQGLARAGIKRLTGRRMDSPISGQRAMTRTAFDAVFPFRKRFGVEVAMTLDAYRAGLSVKEVSTTMGHRETGRDWKGFVHRGRQALDIALALVSRVPRRSWR